MSTYKAEVQVIGETSWSGNGIVTETKEEAEAYAKDLAGRWMMVENWRVVEADKPANYKIDLETGKATAIVGA